MQIAQVIGGYSLGSADLLRRAMGKKKPEEMARQRDIFKAGALKNGVSESKADQLFDLMEKFAGYGFNKSHSAAYALVSYRTAWLKSHHPDQFMAAVLSADMQHTDKIVMLVDEVRRSDLSLDPPDINLSRYRFSVRDGRILYGLGAIRGIGEGTVAGDLREPRAAGAIRRSRTISVVASTRRKANRRAVEALIRARRDGWIRATRRDARCGARSVDRGDSTARCRARNRSRATQRAASAICSAVRSPNVAVPIVDSSGGDRSAIDAPRTARRGKGSARALSHRPSARRLSRRDPRVLSEPRRRSQSRARHPGGRRARRFIAHDAQPARRNAGVHRARRSQRPDRTVGVRRRLRATQGARSSKTRCWWSKARFSRTTTAAR